MFFKFIISTFVHELLSREFVMLLFFAIYINVENNLKVTRYTVILITLRDCNHITWFRNSASVSLLATLSHRTWVASDFSLSQFSQKRSKVSDCTFWKFSYKRKFSFLFISCTRNRHSTVIESYIRRDDVIKCELDLALIKKKKKKKKKKDLLFSSHRSLSRRDW
jgi:hypothetical protein